MINLHLHLDGSLNKEDIEYLAKIGNVSLPEGYEKTLSVDNSCPDLLTYLKCFEVPLLVLQTEELITLAVKRLISNLVKQDYIYAEIRFAPQLHTKQGLNQEQVVKAAIKGLRGTSIPVNLILCAMRNNGSQKENIETCHLVSKYLNQGVVALDLAGAEGLYKTASFTELFSLAKKLNVPFTIHAGESDDYTSVVSALDFGASRIGHGVRSIESPELVELLVKRQIPLELCPTSNIQTKAVPSFKDFPLRYYIDKGVLVTINTDDDAVSGVTLISEYNLIKKEYGVTKEETYQLLCNAIKASFAIEPIKEVVHVMLDDNFDSWYAKYIK